MTILSATHSFNEIAQWILLVIILIIVVVWIVRRATRKKSDCGCGCGKCPLSDKCDDKEDD